MALLLLLWVLAGFLGLRNPPEGFVFQGKSVAAWTLRLNRPAPGERQAAEEAFNSMGTNALPGLVRLLAARDSFLRRQVWALVPRLPGPLVKIVLARVRSPQAEALRSGAAQALALLGPAAEPAVPALARGFRGTDAQLRWYAANALARIGPAGLPELLSALEAQDANRRYAAVAALAHSSCEPGLFVPRVIPLVLDQDDGVRLAAGSTLTALGPAALPSVLNGMRDSAPAVRQRAGRVLAMLPLPRPQTVPPLLNLLRDPDPGCRREAVKCLQRLGIPDADMLGGLLAATSDPDLEVRLEAITALRNWHWRAAGAVPELSRCLADQSPRVRAAAAEALGAIGGAATPARPLLQQLESDRDEAVRAAAKQALGKIGSHPTQAQK